MTSPDPYRVTDTLDNQVLDVMIQRLESRGQHPRFMEMLDDYLRFMNIEESKSVLDLGCGTGIASRAIARRPGFSGNVLGIDLSGYLAEAAKKLATADGVSSQTDFRQGDTQSLQLKSESFDAVVAHTLFSHVDDPMSVLAEAARVVKPSGLIGVFDGDYASITFEQEDQQKAKADDEAVIAALVTQPRIMRQMPRLAKEVGLKLEKTFPYVLTEVGEASFWRSGVLAYSRLLIQSGAMDEAYAGDWEQTLLSASDAGTFFGSSNYYSYVLRKPD